MEVIDIARKDLEARLLELKPYIDEAERIERLLRTMTEADLYDREGRYRERHRVRSEARRLQILSLLRDGKEPIRGKDLAKDLGVTAGRVSQLLGKLEADGHVTREPGGVRITGSGLDLVPPDFTVQVQKPQRVGK